MRTDSFPTIFELHVLKKSTLHMHNIMYHDLFNKQVCCTCLDTCTNINTVLCCKTTNDSHQGWENSEIKDVFQ